MSAPKQDARQRRWSARTSLLTNAALLIGIALMVNYLAFRHYKRWDFTEHQLYTLSDRSRQVLAELEEDVDVWLLLSESERAFNELRNLLVQYEAESSRVNLHFIDPVNDMGAYREFAQRYELGLQITGAGQAGADIAALVAYGDRHWEITRDDLTRRRVDLDSDDDAFELDVESERAITGALVEITTGRATKVCLTRGHGEYDLSTGERSIAAFREEMRRENLELEEIALRTLDAVPEECDAVLIIGPELAFSDEESERLATYLGGGGNALIALDPILTNTRNGLSATGLEVLLRNAGIRLTEALVVEPDPRYLPAGSMGHPVAGFVVADLPEHATTASVREDAPLFLSHARALEVLDDDRVHAILRTSERGYGETQLDSMTELLEPQDNDVQGPAVIGVATQVELVNMGRNPDAAPERQGGRLVVLGDADMFRNSFLSAPELANRLFASSLVGWLADRQALISLPPRTIRRRAITITQEDATNILFRVGVLLPLAFVFLGIGVWMVRRN